jgi:hypothetical protein
MGPQATGLPMRVVSATLIATKRYARRVAAGVDLGLGRVLLSVVDSGHEHVGAVG